MVVKARGEFVWHKHDDTDDFFLVLTAGSRSNCATGAVQLDPGELFVVPRGVEHCPRADQEAHVLLIEPRGTPTPATPAGSAPRSSASSDARGYAG